MPSYLLRVLKDYLWTINIRDNGRYKNPGNNRNGSILGPDLWGIVYDSLLRTQMPEGCSLVGYANDVRVVIVARTPELAQTRLEQVIRRINRWITDHGIELALAKTELILLTRKRIETLIPMTAGTEVIQTKNEVKYLGVILDTKMTFWPHIVNATDKAIRKVAALSRTYAQHWRPQG